MMFEYDDYVSYYEAQGEEKRMMRYGMRRMFPHHWFLRVHGGCIVFEYKNYSGTGDYILNRKLVTNLMKEYRKVQLPFGFRMVPLDPNRLPA